MTTFIKHEDGKVSACNGAHDDLVMASAIAHYIGNDYEHNMLKIDTSSDFLTSNFSISQKNDTYLEW